MTLAVAPESPEAERGEHTFEELLALPDDGKLYELVRGQFVEKQVGFLSIWIAWEISRLIGNFVVKDRQGWVATEVPIDCFPWIPRHGRRPDVVYYRRELLPDGVPTQDPLRVAPSWFVEVLSPNDNAIELDAKMEEYFRAGVELAWVVNPLTRTVRTQDSAGQLRLFHESERVDGSPVLPDFQATVGEFFPVPQPK